MRFEPLRSAPDRQSKAFQPRSAILKPASDLPLSADVDGQAGQPDMAARDEAIDALLSAAKDLTAQVAVIQRRAIEKSAQVIARVVVEAAPVIAFVSAKHAIESVLAKYEFGSTGGAITVTASAQMLAAIRERFSDVADRGLVIFQEDASFGEARVSATWRDGGVDCDLDRTACAIKDVVESSMNQPWRRDYERSS